MARAFFVLVIHACSLLMHLDCEPDFGDFVLGAPPVLCQIVAVAAGDGDAVVAPPVLGIAAVVAIDGDADDFQTPVKRRKHRRTHGAFGGPAARTVEVKRAFSSSGNTVRWAAFRERQLQAIQ